MRATPIFIVAMTVVAAATTVMIDHPKWLTHRAYRMFRSGDVTGAASIWASMEKGIAGSEEASFNRGVAEYRLGNYFAAVRHFRSSATVSGLRARSLYNLGTAEIRIAAQWSSSGRGIPSTRGPAGIGGSSKEKGVDANAAGGAGSSSRAAEERHLKEAVAALRECLAQAPAEEAAASNLRLAEERLAAISGEGIEKDTEPGREQGQEKRQGEQPDPRAPGKGATKPGRATELDQDGRKTRQARIDRNQAQRMLDEARGKESLGSATASTGINRPPAPPDRDW